MANSVDPDQTAPEAVWSGSALFAYAILPETLVFEIIGHLPYTLHQQILINLVCRYSNCELWTTKYWNYKISYSLISNCEMRPMIYSLELPS